MRLNLSAAEVSRRRRQNITDADNQPRKMAADDNPPVKSNSAAAKTFPVI